MSVESTTSPHYVLVIDKKADEILGAMLEVIMHTPSAFYVFDRICKSMKIEKEEVVTLINDMSDKQHALGWCEDPNCKVIPKTN